MKRLIIALLLAPTLGWAQNGLQLLENLKRIESTGTVLHVAAHPDDESTHMLAWFAQEQHWETNYFAFTRGDGGQNLIGDEQGIPLGLIRTQELLAENDTIKPLKNLLSGTTKSGTYGKEYYDIREKIVSLSNPLMTEEAKKEVELYYSEDMDPEGRGYKNLMKMMIEDGLFKYLPKEDDAWVEFLQPIMKLTRKEKKRYNKNN
jgi:hypothetical protein